MLVVVLAVVLAQVLAAALVMPLLAALTCRLAFLGGMPWWWWPRRWLLCRRRTCDGREGGRNDSRADRDASHGAGCDLGHGADHAATRGTGLRHQRFAVFGVGQIQN